jgi:hypothetical protein
MARKPGVGITSPPPQPQSRAQYTREQRQSFNSGAVPDPRAPRANAPLRTNEQRNDSRINAAERRMINQGKMQAPAGYQMPQNGQPQPMQRPNPQQMPQQPGLPSITQNGQPYQPQPLPQTLPDGSQRQPGDPNRYTMGPNGQMYGTLIGYPGHGGGGFGGQQYPGGAFGMQGQPAGIQYNGGSQQQPMNPQWTNQQGNGALPRRSPYGY